MANETARGLFMTITPVNGFTKFSPSPPDPPGPVLLCPYVMDSQSSPTLGGAAFDTFNFTDGTLYATTSSDGNQSGQAIEDYSRQIEGVPAGESYWWSVAPGSGKVAMEAKAVTVSDELGRLSLNASTGNPIDSNFAQAGADLDPDDAGYRVFGVGSRYLGGGATTQDVVPAPGDRIGVVIDTDDGSVDLITSYGHENFGGIPVIDMSDGAGFLITHSMTGTPITPQSSETYTKAADMQLPYPPGTKDTCGNAVTRELVTYPLDATEAEIQGAGITGKLSDVSLAEQQGSYVVPDGSPASSERHVLAKSPSSPDFSNDWSSGKLAMEFELTVPSFTPEGGGIGSPIANARGEIVSAVTFTQIALLTVTVLDDGTRTLSASGPNGGSTSGVVTQDTNRLGLLIDNDTGAMRVWLNAVEQSLGDLSFPAGTFDTVTPVPGVFRSSADDIGAAGIKLTARMITDPYWFTTPFPAGSVAIDGVTPADTVKPSPESFFTVGDVGGLWHTKYQDTLSKENSDPVLAPGDDVYTIASAVSTPTTVAIENTQPYDAIWRDNYMDSPDGVSIFRGDLGSNNHSRGVLVMGLVKYTTAPNVPGADAFWINNHNVPLVQFQDAADGTGMIIKPRLNSSTDYITAALNDGLPHTVGWDFNPSGNLLRFIVDGVVVGTAIANITTQNWGRVALTVGDRDGLDQDSWALFVRDRVAGSPEEIQALHDLMVSGLVT